MCCSPGGAARYQLDYSIQLSEKHSELSYMLLDTVCTVTGFLAHSLQWEFMLIPCHTFALKLL